MTQQAINLQDGLEAWYTFDSDYFDPQRNLLMDQSGYGRHASAKNGVTAGGAEGPDSFEASSFNGTDHRFSGSPFTIGDEMTVSCLMKLTTDRRATQISNGSGSSGGNKGFGLRFDTTKSPNQIEWSFGGGNKLINSTDDIGLNQWIFSCGRYNTTGSTETMTSFAFSQNSLVNVSREEGTGFVNQESNEDTLLGKEFGYDVYHEGQISFISLHGRALSDAEIEYLNNLTGPRRSQL